MQYTIHYIDHRNMCCKQRNKWNENKCSKQSNGSTKFVISWLWKIYKFKASPNLYNMAFTNMHFNMWKSNIDSTIIRKSSKGNICRSKTAYHEKQKRAINLINNKIISIYLQHAKNFDAKLIVEVLIFRMRHVINKYKAISLSLNAEIKREKFLSQNKCYNFFVPVLY